MDARQFGGARREEKHVARAQEFFRPVLIKDGAGIHLRRYLKRDARGEIGLDDARNDVHRGALGGEDQVDARRSRHLGQTRQGFFHVALGDEHQICQFINEDHNIGQLLRQGDIFIVRQRTMFGAIFAQARQHAFFILFRNLLFQQPVVGFDVFYAREADDLITAFHLLHRPFQHLGRHFGIQHHGVEEVRYAFIGRKFQPLGVNHKEFYLVRRRLEEDAANQGIQGHAFSRTCSARNQEVGHPDQVGDHRHSGNVHPQGDRQAQGGTQEGIVIEHVLELHGIAFLLRNLNAHRRLSRDGGDDPDAGRLQCQSQVVGEVRDPVDLDARRRLQLVHGDHGPRFDFHHFSLDAEVGELAFQESGVSEQGFPLDLRILVFHLIEQRQRRQLEVAACLQEVKV